jgi:hypothetical protein
MMEFGGTDEYAMWDAAYVLGCLSSAERLEYEAHLATCASCRQSVGELGGMPALLSQLSPDEVAAIDEPGGQEVIPPLPPQLRNALLAKVSGRRRRAHLLTWTVAAVTAVVLVIAVFVALWPNPAQTSAPPPQIQASAVAMTPVKPSEITATVALTAHGWGTQIEMTCTYGAAPENTNHGGDTEAGERLAMVVVNRDGSQTRLATWVALEGVTATPSGQTSMPIDQITAVQIVSADSGDVLLQHSL